MERKRKLIFFSVIFFSLCAVFATASKRWSIPQKLGIYPLNAEPKHVLNMHATAMDLDGDGYEELLGYLIGAKSKQAQNVDAIWAFDFDGRSLAQMNVAGKLLRAFLLVSSDDLNREILLTYLRNDSLFSAIFSASGVRRLNFLLTTGVPRIEGTDTFPWDPEVQFVWREDLDSNGKDELIFAVTTHFARAPRGIIVCDAVSGEIISSCFVGAKNAHYLLDDFNNDGSVELLATSFTVNNGANAGGLSDDRSWIMEFALWPRAKLNWHEQLPGNLQHTQLGYIEAADDGKKSLVVAFRSTSTGKRTYFQIRESATKAIIHEKRFAEDLHLPFMFEQTQQGHNTLLARTKDGLIRYIDADLNSPLSLRTTADLQTAYLIDDIDGDNRPEVYAAHKSTPSLIYTADFIPLVRFDGVPKSYGYPVIRTKVLHRPDSELEVLLDRESHSEVLKLSQNHLYLLASNGLPIAAALLLMTTGQMVISRRNRQKSKLATELFQKALRNQEKALCLLLDERGDIQHLSGRRNVLHFKAHLGEVPREGMSIFPVFREQKHAQEIKLLLGTENRTAHLRLRNIDAPITSPANVDITRTTLFNNLPGWIVIFTPGNSESTGEQQIWQGVAKQVAHDIKSRLTAVKMNLQKLESLMQRSEVSKEMLRSLRNTHNAVESMRAYSRNLLKLMDDASPDLTVHSPKKVLQRFFRERRADLASDIKIDLQFQETACRVQIDIEQFCLVLENLYVNALNAMPDGGIIYVRDTLLQPLALDNQSGATLYQISISDTGVGIPLDHLELIFSPGFTTNEMGNGFGLSFARKIIEKFGGSLSVSSTPGAGAEFRITLPLHNS